jgi:sec-independent protein translocase protein TatA
MFGLGITELLIVFGIILLLFGGKRIPEFASGLGEGIRSFKKAMHEDPTAKTDKVAIEETSKSK